MCLQTTHSFIKQNMERLISWKFVHRLRFHAPVIYIAGTLLKRLGNFESKHLLYTSKKLYGVLVKAEEGMLTFVDVSRLIYFQE